jgi:O-antigen ligase
MKTELSRSDDTPRTALTTKGGQVPLPARQLVHLLTLGSSVAIAGSMALAGRGRIRSGVNLPGAHTYGSQLFGRLAIALAVAAGLAGMLFLRRARLPRFYAGAALGLLLIILTNYRFSGQHIGGHAYTAVVIGTAVLLCAPLGWAGLLDREIATAVAPLTILAAVSCVTYVLQGQYYFDWYDQWGLVAVIIGCCAVALTELSLPTRLTMGAVSVASVALSTSRQALLGLMLVLAVTLWRSKGLTSTVSRVWGALIAGGIAYAAVAASSRVSQVGGVAGNNGRYALWSSGWSVIKQSPWRGIAGAHVDPDLTTALTTVGLGWSASVHNFVLDMWLRGGVLAAVLAALLILSVTFGRTRRGRIFGLGVVPFFLFGAQLLYVDQASLAILVAVPVGIGLTGASRATTDSAKAASKKRTG